MDQWTIELKQDADFWEDQVTVEDENGSPVTFSDAQITIHPNKGENETVYPDVVWSVANEKLLIVSAGVFGFEIPMTEIADYEWTSGKYCWSVTYTDGHIDGSWMTGKVTIKKACL